MSENSELGIALVQFPIQWEDKIQSQKVIEELLVDLPSNVHIIVLPEMFLTGFSMNVEALSEDMEGPSIQWMRRTSIALRKIVCGSLIIKEDDKYYNRLIWMMPNGQYYHYDKYHLFSKANEHKHYSPGRKKLIVQVNGWRIYLQTCYDLRFPVLARQTTELYDVMINVAQWPDIRSEAFTSLLKARAIENQSYVVAVNGYGHDGNGMYYSGHSSAFRFDGHLLVSIAHESGVRHVYFKRDELTAFRKQFPFLEDRDRFIILEED